MVLRHDRQRWSKGLTVKCLLVSIVVSYQVTQYLFRDLDITAKWTGFDHSRVMVFVTCLTKRGNVHRDFSPDGSMKPYIRRVPYDTMLAVLVLENRGAAGHANSSNNAFASFKSAVSNPTVNQW
jgi:hypothetical protein